MTTKTENLNRLEKEVLGEIQEGDILFISIDSFLYKQVAKGTGSWCSHVGFAIKEGDDWFVLESALPFVTKCPLRKFLKRTCNSEFAMRRLKSGLTNDQIEALKKNANKRMGKLYHLGFKYDSSREFCSKFVHNVFKETLSIEIGKVQTLKELLEENPQASVGFWRAWFFGFIPWSRRTVTPASQLVDEKLVTVLGTT